MPSQVMTITLGLSCPLDLGTVHGPEAEPVDSIMLRSFMHDVRKSRAQSRDADCMTKLSTPEGSV